jgi:hypothetical protein
MVQSDISQPRVKEIWRTGENLKIKRSWNLVVEAKFTMLIPSGPLW